VPPHDLVKLDDALRRMDLQRQPAFARRRGAVSQQLFGTGVDLSRVKRAVETA
jgi:recombinational DNA repair ATPase RecF